MFSRLREFFWHDEKKLRDNRWIFASMLVGSIIGLIAALVLSIEAIELAKQPNAALSCNFNAVINCGTVGKTWQANLLGFPNSFFGLMSEPIVITVAIAGLAAVRFPRWFMRTAQVFYTLGFVFAFWLFYQSFVVIQALCPWCLLVTLTTTMVWFAMTRYNIRENNLGLPHKFQKVLHSWIEKDFDKLAMWSLIVVVIALILVKYGHAIFA